MARRAWGLVCVVACAAVYAPSPPAAASQKKSGNLKVLLIAGVGLFLMCGVGVGAVGYLAMEGTTEPTTVTEAERAALLTYDDLVAHAEELADQKVDGVEVFRRGGFLGSQELEYEYETPGDEGIYLTSLITVERTTREARESYVGMRLGMGAMLAVNSEGVTRKERNDLFKWGDQSDHYLLMYEDLPVGNLFLARKDRHIYFVSVGGLAFTDAPTLEALLRERLERAVAWKPK